MKKIIILLFSIIIINACTNKIMAPIRTDEDTPYNSYKGEKKEKNTIDTKEIDLPEKIENPLGVDESKALGEEKNISNQDIAGEIKTDHTDYDVNDYDQALQHELAKLDFDNSSEDNATSKTPHSNFLPVNGKIINYFGDLIGEKKLTGVNIQAPLGTPVLSASDGKVICAKYDKSYGNIIIIANSSKKTHMAYAHLQNIILHEGDEVKYGQVIGKIGNSGAKTNTPMLHFVIRENKIPVDPLKYLNYTKE